MQNHFNNRTGQIQEPSLMFLLISPNHYELFSHLLERYQGTLLWFQFSELILCGGAVKYSRPRER